MSDVHGVYGAPPADLASLPAGAVQFSPLVPGAAALELQPEASLASMTMLAPRGNRERRYAIAMVLRALRPGGALVALAPKTAGGARLHVDLAGFGCVSEEAARRHHRICTGRRPDQLDGLDEATLAGAPRFVEALGLWSQPGVFSWDRIDRGSALLVKHLPSLSGRGADLGCGIGVLTRAVLQQQDVQHITLIDIDRRAIEAARRNVDAARTTVLWADARKMDAVPKGLDFVVMNPPFHDGGVEDQDLGRWFLKGAADVLRPGGVCLITANRHLPYEAAMQPLFSDITRLVQAEGYKVYAARK